MSRFSEEDFRKQTESNLEGAYYDNWKLAQDNAELRELLRWAVEQAWARTKWDDDFRISPEMKRIEEILK